MLNIEATYKSEELCNDYSKIRGNPGLNIKPVPGGCLA